MCSVEQWPAEEHGGVWWCAVACWFTLWSKRSDSHCIEYTWGVSNIVTLVGHEMMQDGAAIARGIQQCIVVGRDVQWHAEVI